VSRLVDEEQSVLLQGAKATPASGPIKLHYTRAAVGLGDYPQFTRTAW
jgi:hypothetical protein